MFEGLSQKMGNIIGFFALAFSSGTAISSYNEWLVHFDQHAPAYGFFVSAFVAAIHLIFKWLEWRKNNRR